MEIEKSLIVSDDRMVIQSYLMTTAKFKFSIYEKRILGRLIQLMQPMLEGQKLRGKVIVNKNLWDEYNFEMPISLLATDTNQTRFKDAIKALHLKYFEYKDEEGNWEIIHLIETPKILKKGIIRFRLSDKLVNVFLDFSKGYSKYNSEVSLNLKSIYSMRLYELISNQKKPITFKIETLREMFKLGDKYKLIGSFIQKIIDPSKKELDGFANWSFDYKPIKRGRKYEYIEFSPIHYTDRESPQVQQAEILRQVNLSWDIPTQVRKFLIDTCRCSERILKQKKTRETIQAFITIYQTETLNKLNEIWERANREGKNRQKYLIGAINREVETNK